MSLTLCLGCRLLQPERRACGECGDTVERLDSLPLALFTPVETVQLIGYRGVSGPPNPTDGRQLQPQPVPPLQVEGLPRYRGEVRALAATVEALIGGGRGVFSDLAVRSPENELLCREQRAVPFQVLVDNRRTIHLEGRMRVIGEPTAYATGEELAVMLRRWGFPKGMWMLGVAEEILLRHADQVGLFEGTPTIIRRLRPVPKYYDVPG